MNQIRRILYNRLEEVQAKPRLFEIEESIRHPDVREVGSEWLWKQALDQLGLRDYLCDIGFKEEDANLALTQIIARAVYPASKLETARWIIENSAVCGLTGCPIDKITKDKLYKSCLNLFNYCLKEIALAC